MTARERASALNDVAINLVSWDWSYVVWLWKYERLSAEKFFAIVLANFYPTQDAW
jgi:hypothetical protein